MLTSEKKKKILEILDTTINMNEKDVSDEFRRNGLTDQDLSELEEKDFPPDAKKALRSLREYCAYIDQQQG